MYEIYAYTQGARWVVVSGLSTKAAADKALIALIGRDGLTAADASGRRVAVKYEVIRADS